MIQNNLQYLLKHPDISLEAPASNDYIEVNDAATGETLAWVKTYDRAGVEAAINRSAKAQAAWKKQTALARADVLLAWYNLMLEHKENLAQILTAEQGKPLAEARGEIGYAASFIRWFAEQARRVDGEVLTPTLPNQRLLVIKQAIGVTAAITPWNFPAAMITRKAGPAIAAGCSMLVKPAEQTPLTAYALEVLALQAGLPADVLINISGDAVEVGKTLCESDIVRKLSFTGSTQVGRILMQQCAPTIKNFRLNWVVTRLYWYLMMPTLNKRFRASWQVNIVTAVKPVSVLTVFMFKMAFTMHWQSIWLKLCLSLKLAMAVKKVQPKDL